MQAVAEDGATVTTASGQRQGASRRSCYASRKRVKLCVDMPETAWPLDADGALGLSNQRFAVDACIAETE